MGDLSNNLVQAASSSSYAREYIVDVGGVVTPVNDTVLFLKISFTLSAVDGREVEEGVKRGVRGGTVIVRRVE